MLLTLGTMGTNLNFKKKPCNQPLQGFSLFNYTANNAAKATPSNKAAIIIIAV